MSNWCNLNECILNDSALVCQGCHNKVPETEWLQQQKCIFSHIQRLDVQDQGVVRVGKVRQDLEFAL